MDFPTATTVPLLMDGLRHHTRPALVWYGADGERVELSGRVLDNWAAKTANLWVDELDLAAGDVVAVGDDVHWRGLAAVLGTWTMGAAVLPVDPAGSGGAAGARAVVALVDARGGLPPLVAQPPARARAVVVDRPALSLGYRGELPGEDAVDYCAEIRAHADVYAGFEEPGPQDPALLAAHDADPVLHGQLLPRARELAGAREPAWGAAAAVHVPGRRMDEAFLLRVLGVLASGRAVVVTDRDAADEAWDAVLAAENATGF
ncbi:TIGR03089 family protein [Kocuria rosea]|uniref:TIGR03089 family protein n=1 Tax=Kocuria rosea TaxID=1275 RepID=UPI00203A4D6D|nr:TIGR03089 family protein [Kocuria rosea]MCM3688260.1 TIGR03089 family protein [Kocuria rosea]